MNDEWEELERKHGDVPFYDDIRIYREDWQMDKLDEKIEACRESKNLKNKVDILVDIICNHVLHMVVEQGRRSKWTDIKLNFVLAFMAIIVALLAFGAAEFIRTLIGGG